MNKNQTQQTVPDGLALHEIDLKGLAASAREMAQAFSTISELSARATPEILQTLEALVPTLSLASESLLSASEQLTQLASVLIYPQPLAMYSRDATPITRDRILVVTKPSKIECEARDLGLSFERVVELQRERGEDWQRNYNSHAQQLAARAQVLEGLTPEQVVFGRDLEGVDLGKYDLVVCLGGDNHLQYVAEKLKANIPILGVSSDPIFSVGALLPLKAAEFSGFLKCLESGDYKLQSWTRLKAKVGDKELPPAMCDLFIGELNRLEMSRHIASIVEYDDGSELVREPAMEQKSSGALVATGAGSTGWFKNASRQFLLHPKPFSPQEPIARLVLTEYSAAIKDKEGNIIPLEKVVERATVVLKAGETLLVRSLNDSHGVICSDSNAKIDFPRGAEAQISIDEKPFWVVGRK